MKILFSTLLLALSFAFSEAAPPVVVPSTQGITVNINGAVAWPENAMTIQTFESENRETTKPNSTGQIGLQVDDKTLWIASGLEAGDWEPYLREKKSVNVQLIKTPGDQWVKPLGAKLVQVKLVSGASSGGEPSYPDSYTRLGGRGGYPGRHFQAEFVAELLPTELEVVVGKGGDKGAGEAGGDTVFGDITVAGAPAPTSAGSNILGQHVYFGVTQLSAAMRTLYAGGSEHSGPGGAPTTAQQAQVRIPTGGGGGGSSSVTWRDGYDPIEATEGPIAVTLQNGGVGGAIGTGTNLPILGGTGGILPTDASYLDLLSITDPIDAPNRNGHDGKYDPLSGMCSGAGGGAAGWPGIIEPGDGGDGAYPGGAAGGGGSSGGRGGKGGDGMALIITYCE